MWAVHDNHTLRHLHLHSEVQARLCFLQLQAPAQDLQQPHLTSSAQTRATGAMVTHSGMRELGLLSDCRHPCRQGSGSITVPSCAVAQMLAWNIARRQCWKRAFCDGGNISTFCKKHSLACTPLCKCKCRRVWLSWTAHINSRLSCYKSLLIDYSLLF